MRTEVPATSYDRSEKTRTAVDQLRILIQILFPDPSPDIFTLKDFLNRYPLTGLGSLATREIEQAQRINRNLDNYLNLGLCEFHIGLIYLYWGDSRGAVQQFQLARKNWAFSDAAETKPLCHFAEGLANFLALHFEEAMRCYSLAANALSRVNPQENEDYHQEISAYIRNAQLFTRDAMWGSVKPRPTEQPQEEEAEEPAREPAAPPAANIPDKNVAKPQPSAPQSAAEAVAEDAEFIPPPQIHLSSHPQDNDDIPLPGHHLQSNSNYGWYQVEHRSTDNLYEDVSNGDWLLVNTQPADNTTVDKNEMILVQMDEDIGSAIRIRPKHPTRPYQRIYLAKNDDFIGPFNRDLETGSVTLIKVTFSSQDQQISVQSSAIIGIVEGFWRNINLPR